MTVATIGTVVGAIGGTMSIVNQLSGGSSMQSAGQNAIAASDPFGAYRGTYANKLNAFMANPATAMNDPALQAQMNLGMQGVNRSMAAQGFLGSGNQATALYNYGMGQAQSWEQQQQQFLAMLAGAGVVPNATGAGLNAMGAGYGMQQDAFGQLGAAMNMFGGSGNSNMFGGFGSPNMSLSAAGNTTPPSSFGDNNALNWGPAG